MTASLKCDYCYCAHDDYGNNCNDVSDDDHLHDNHDVDVDSDDNDDKKKKSKEIFFQARYPYFQRQL